MQHTNPFESYLSCFQDLTPHTDTSLTQLYTGTLYPVGTSLDEPFMTIHAGGFLNATYPYTYANAGVPYYILLYTEKGAGSIHVNEQLFTLNENHFLILTPNQAYQITLTRAPWDYYVFFVQGSLIEHYVRYFTDSNLLYTKITDQASILQRMKHLTLHSCESDPFFKISDSRILTDLLTDIYTECKPVVSYRQIPPYIEDMHQIFEHSYADSFSLDDFEAHYKISKYRLCREYTQYYGESPLAALNHKRIEISKELLTSTDLKIYEIGIAVGIENTNHFINLFKKNTGVTPLYYRSHHPA